MAEEVATFFGIAQELTPLSKFEVPKNPFKYEFCNKRNLAKLEDGFSLVISMLKYSEC